MNASTLVQKRRNLCPAPRKEGLGFGDYLERMGAVPATREASKTPRGRKPKELACPTP